MACILVIDDDDGVRTMLRLLLEEAGYTVLDASTGRAGVACCENHPVDVVLLDLLMPGQDGFDTLRVLRRLAPAPKVIVMSGGGVTEDSNFLTMALLLGAHRVMQKPLRSQDVLTAVLAVLTVP